MAHISPCIQVCRVNAAGFCVGCKRTRAEIGAWARLSDAEAVAIMATLPARKIDSARPK